MEYLVVSEKSRNFVLEFVKIVLIYKTKAKSNGKNRNIGRDYASPFPTGKRPFHSE
jgi:hypothetical protein